MSGSRSLGVSRCAARIRGGRTRVDAHLPAILRKIADLAVVGGVDGHLTRRGNSQQPPAQLLQWQLETQPPLELGARLRAIGSGTTAGGDREVITLEFATQPADTQGTFE